MKFSLPARDEYPPWHCSTCKDQWSSIEKPEHGVCPKCYTPEPHRPTTLVMCGAPHKAAHEEYVRPDPMPEPAHGSWKDWTVMTLLGNTGTGKTMAALEVLWRSVLAGKTSYFRHSADLMDDLMGRDEYAKMKARSVSLLVIDDVGTRTDEYFWGKVGELIERRIADGKKTVITTNLKLNLGSDELPGIKHYRPRLADRLENDLVVPMLGKSKRRKEGAC